jgi:Zn-dependent protease with chaperone function
MKRLGMGQVVILAALIVILIVTAVWATSVWNAAGDTAMDKHGWIALGLGTFFSLLIGCGLMALMFFSSRSGHDEAADPFRRREPPAD